MSSGETPWPSAAATGRININVEQRSISAPKSLLPAADPGDVISHRWRKRLCRKTKAEGHRHRWREGFPVMGMPCDLGRRRQLAAERPSCSRRWRRRSCVRLLYLAVDGGRLPGGRRFPSQVRPRPAMEPNGPPAVGVIADTADWSGRAKHEAAAIGIYATSGRGFAGGPGGGGSTTGRWTTGGPTDT
jgi:hypothetical protein